MTVLADVDADRLQCRITELEVAVDEMRRRLALLEQESRPARGPRDHADLVLASVICAETEGRDFSTRELFRHAGVRPALQAALAAADVDNARQCGRLLRRLEGRPVSGVVVVRVDVDHRDGVLWRVSRV